MSIRAAAGALVASAIIASVGRPAFADDPAPAAPPAAAPSAAPVPPPAAPAPQAQQRGAVVVAVGDAAAPAARALAMDVYRDAALRPPIDETTARVLAGEAPSGAAPAAARLKELADLRATIAGTKEDLVTRRLLSSLGAELGVPLVISVTVDAGRPVARALRVQGAAYERVELGATIETAPDGSKTYRWPGATATLRGFLGIAEAPTAEPLRPIAPKAPAPPKPAESRPFYKSPWFWGTAGVVAAAGITVLVLSRTTGGPGDVHLSGRVGQ